MIPASDLFDQSMMTALLEHDPLVQDYRAFFALLDWSLVEQFHSISHLMRIWGVSRRSSLSETSIAFWPEKGKVSHLMGSAC
jgi:hypothetical protein